MTWDPHGRIVLMKSRVTCVTAWPWCCDGIVTPHCHWSVTNPPPPSHLSILHPISVLGLGTLDSYYVIINTCDCYLPLILTQEQHSGNLWQTVHTLWVKYLSIMFVAMHNHNTWDLTDNIRNVIHCHVVGNTLVIRGHIVILRMRESLIELITRLVQWILSENTEFNYR